MLKVHQIRHFSKLRDAGATNAWFMGNDRKHMKVTIENQDKPYFSITDKAFTVVGVQIRIKASCKNKIKTHTQVPYC